MNPQATPVWTDEIKLVREEAAKIFVDEYNPPWLASVWNPARWRDAFIRLFVETIVGAPTHTSDDLLFFVHQDPDTNSEPQSETTVTVRRKREGHVPLELAEGSAEGYHVQWRASVLLNLILQSSYRLAVATCRPETLGSVGKDLSAVDSAHQVLTPVYASAMRVAVNLDNSRTADTAPQSSYPDICFALDTFGEDLHSMVMQEDQQCFAVVLSVASSPLLPDGVAAVTQSKDDNHLHDDAAGMQSKPPSSASAVSVPATASHPEAVRPASYRAGSNDATTCEATTLPGQENYDKSVEDDDAWLLVGGGRSDPPPQGEQSIEDVASLSRHQFSDPLFRPSCRPGALPAQHHSMSAAPHDVSTSASSRSTTVFSGYVICEHLRPAVQMARSHVTGEGPCHVVMNGPGRQGKADVAVSVAKRPHVDAAPPWQGHNRGSPGALLGRAAGVAGRLVTGMIREILDSDAAECPLYCRLMSLSVPVESLLRELLKQADGN